MRLGEIFKAGLFVVVADTWEEREARMLVSIPPPPNTTHLPDLSWSPLLCPT